MKMNPEHLAQVPVPPPEQDTVAEHIDSAEQELSAVEYTYYLRMLIMLCVTATLLITLQFSISREASAEEDITFAPAITDSADVKAVSITAWDDFTKEHYNGSGVGIETTSGSCEYVVTARHIFPLYVNGIDISTSTHAVTRPDGELFTAREIIIPSDAYSELIGDVALIKLWPDDCLPEQVRFTVGEAITGVAGRVQGYGIDQTGEPGQLRESQGLILFKCVAEETSCLTNYNPLHKAGGGDSGAGLVTSADEASEGSSEEVVRGVMEFPSDELGVFGRIQPFSLATVRWIAVCTDPSSPHFAQACEPHRIPADLTKSRVFLSFISAGSTVSAADSQ